MDVEMYLPVLELVYSFNISFLAREMDVTKSGKHFIVVVDGMMKILSSSDGNVVREFGYNEFGYNSNFLRYVSVDTTGMIWTCDLGNKLLCFTENGKLVRAIKLGFFPNAITCCLDGRILVVNNSTLILFTQQYHRRASVLHSYICIISFI